MCFLLVFCVQFPSYGSQILEGENNQEFQQAVQLWLADDDVNSLPKLAKLAKEGNVAARVLLARIEQTDQSPSQFVQGLTRRQKAVLYRAPSSTKKFFRSWIDVEAERGLLLATWLRQTQDPYVNLPLIEKLSNYGEKQATYHLVYITGVYGTDEQRAKLLSTNIPPELKTLC